MEYSNVQCKLKGCFRNKNEYYLKIQSVTNAAISTGTYSVSEVLNKYHPMLINYFSPQDASTITALAKHNTQPIIETVVPPPYHRLYCFLLILQLAIYVSANIMSTKIMHIAGVDIVAGALCFPIFYSISSIIVEFFGFKMARDALIFSVIGNGIIVFLIQCALYVPSSELWGDQTAFSKVFNASAWLFISSSIAIFIGDFINSYLQAYLKEKYLNIRLTLRILITSSLGIFIDSILFITLSNFYTLEITSLLNMLLNVLFHKFMYEVLTCSFIAFLIKQVQKKYEGLDYNPLKVRFF